MVSYRELQARTSLSVCISIWAKAQDTVSFFKRSVCSRKTCQILSCCKIQEGVTLTHWKKKKNLLHWKKPLYLLSSHEPQKQQAQGQVCVYMLWPNTSEAGLWSPTCLAPSQVCSGSYAHRVPRTVFVSLRFFQMRRLETRSDAAIHSSGMSVVQC